MSITAECRREAYDQAQTDAPTRRSQIYRTLSQHGPMSSDDLMMLLGYSNPNSIRPRLTDLKDEGKIEAVGKATNANGRSVTVWRVTGGQDTHGTP